MDVNFLVNDLQNQVAEERTKNKELSIKMKALKKEHELLLAVKDDFLSYGTNKWGSGGLPASLIA